MSQPLAYPAPPPRPATRRSQMKQPSLARTKKLLADNEGANLGEYIILVGVIALIAIAGFKLFGQKVQAKIQEQSESVGGINGAAK